MQRCVLVKVLLAVYVSAGTVNHGRGIYNTSLPSHHKTLMFINVNAYDLYLNVIYMSQLKGVLMRRDGEEGGGWRARRTDRQGRQMRGTMCEGMKSGRRLLFFTLCLPICHEICLFHVAYLQSISYGYLSVSHSQKCHFLLFKFVGADEDSLLLII